MTTQTGSNGAPTCEGSRLGTPDYYERGLELAEAGQYQEGLNCIREHLRAAPNDAQALNDAGAILHCLGRTGDAIGHLAKARRLRAESGEIVWNLVEAYLAGGMAGEAAALLDDMERMGIVNVDVLNRIATMLLDQGRKGEAIEVLLRSYRLWPEQEVLPPILDVIRSQRPRVAFCRTGDGADGALADICGFAQQRFRTEFYEGRDPQGVIDLLQRNDIVWLDGGGAPVVEASQAGGNCRMVVSLRRSDVGDRWAQEVRWESVDILVQIGSCAVEEALLRQVSDLRNRTRLVVLPHGVNLDRYALRRRPRGKHLACLGCLRLEANPAFLLQCMQKLHYLDPACRLFFSGVFESPVLEQYVRHMVSTLDLTDVVSFEPFPGDLNHWLSDKHFIVAGGIGEDQVEALLMGMACGLKPVIHHFPGASRLFPERYLFNIAEQFCEQVLSGDYEPQQYRRFVEERHPMKEQVTRVNGILTQLETEIELQTAANPAPGQAAPSQGCAPRGDSFAVPALGDAMRL
jgi:glycosyltransferase involved in cell wall biosynthesis